MNDDVIKAETAMQELLQNSSPSSFSDVKEALGSYKESDLRAALWTGVADGTLLIDDQSNIRLTLR